MNRKLAILLFVIVLFVSCSKPVNEVGYDPVNEPKTASEKPNVVSELDLSEEEQVYLDELKSKGVLKIASRQIETVLKVVDGEKTGFNYSAIKKFADAVDIELEITTVDSIEAFFRKDGVFDEAVRLDTTIEYKPDLLNDVDVYVDTLTQLSWREKLMDFIGFTPIRELVIHQPNVDIDNIYDMNGKTVAVQSVSSYMSTLLELEKTYNIDIEYVYTDTIFDSLTLVDDEKVDFTIMDSNRAFLEAKKFNNIEVGIPVTDVKFVGWAVARDTPELKSILTKYMDALIDKGIINELWLTDYEISFYEYYTLILKDANVLATMNLSREELTYIDQLRERGVLRVGMQANVVGYYPDRDTQTGYNYLLARDLAQLLGVKLDVMIIEKFPMYFWKDGETPEEIKLDSNYFYVPDLFDKLDIYTENLTHVPWRGQILNQIEGVPVSTVVVQMKNFGITDLSDLDGRTIALMKDSSHEVVMNEIAKAYDIEFDVYPVFNEVGGYEAVLNGYAEATVQDSDLGFLILRDYPELEITLQASGSDFVGWAVKKDDIVLASILTKYIEAMKSNGKFDEYWETTYGVSYPEYMRLLTD